MSAAKIILAAAAVGIGLVVLSRSSAVAAPARAPAPSGPSTLNPTATTIVPPLPGLGQAYAVLKPVADHITTPLVHSINSAVGGVDPYGKLTRNADGTYTDGTGATVTLNANGTITRKAAPGYSSWYYNNIGHPISQAGTGVVHAFESIL